MKRNMLWIVVICSLFFCPVFARNIFPIGIIGGQSNAPYAAFVYSDGSIQPLRGLPLTGLTYRVAITRQNLGLVGGTDGVNAYAAYVAPNGVVSPLQGLIAPGEIYSVALNQSGNGIIGGGHQATNIPYAALVSPEGSVLPLTLPGSGLMYSVAINNSGEAIIGGIGPVNSAYAAVVNTNGLVTPLAGLPATGGIFWVAVNESNRKFIGGQGGASLYAAFVESDNTVVPIAGLPLGTGYSVAINNAGSAIIGGTSLSLPYAALVSSGGNVRTLAGLPTTPGIIYTVALNDSGTGLIAGFSAEGPYGTFVAPSGALTPLRRLPVGSGFLDAAALHPTGIGLVGGQIDGAPFAALVAPNGALTYLDGLPTAGAVNTAALSGALDNLIPRGVGFLNSWSNTQFTLSNVLTQHCLYQHYHHCDRPCSTGCEDSLVWASVFGNYVREQAHDHNPKYCNTIVGGLVGVDYNGYQDAIIGAGLSYAYNKVHYFRNFGHCNINQETAVIYGSWNKPHFYMNAAIWGGLFQATNTRTSLGFIHSRARPHGWNLAPHLEFSFPYYLNCCHCVVFDPFVSVDLASNWQYRFRERGSSGFNLKVNDRRTSVVRSEVGVRFYEDIDLCYGNLFMVEKFSFVNRAPFHRGRSRASFIGSSSCFNVETVSHRVLNCGVAQLHIEYAPSCSCGTYGSLDYQGEYASGFTSQMLTFELGKRY